MSTKVSSESPKICFFGRSSVSLSALLKYTVPELVIVENVPAAEKILLICEQNNIVCSKVNSSEELLDVFQKYVESIDLLVVSGCGIILSNDFIKHCGYIVNIHSGLLPECRGRQPLVAAIRNHHEFMGVTAHLITNQKIDAGPVIAKMALPINYDADYKHNSDLLQQAEISVLNIVLHEFLQNKSFNLYSVTAPGTYYKRFSPQEMEYICHLKTLNELFCECQDKGKTC